MTLIKITGYVDRVPFWDSVLITTDEFSVLSKGNCTSSMQYNTNRDSNNSLVREDYCRFCAALASECSCQKSYANQNNVNKNCHNCEESNNHFNVVTRWEKVTLNMDGQVFSYAMKCLKESPSFRQCCAENLHQYLLCKRVSLVEVNCSSPLLFALEVRVKVMWPKQCVMNKSWNARVDKLLWERREIENTMAWLSTLGGAYSSLGDCHTEFAKKALWVSIEQLKIAMKIGNPFVITRCKIYIALSVMQRGYLRLAKHILKQEYSFAQSPQGLTDNRLMSIWKFAWKRLAYIKQNNKSNHFEQELSPNEQKRMVKFTNSL